MKNSTHRIEDDAIKAVRRYVAAPETTVNGLVCEFLNGSNIAQKNKKKYISIIDESNRLIFFKIHLNIP